MASSPHEIVIVGGNMAAVSLCHALLKRTIPKLERAGGRNYKVVIISESTRCFWNIAAPRAMANESLASNDMIFASIVDVFEKYGSDRFQFIHARVTGLDPTRNALQISLLDDELQIFEEKAAVYEYSSLVIATGGRGKTPSLRLKGSHADTVAALESARSICANAKTILVAGAGAAGVEIAGELAEEFTDKTIILASSRNGVLPGLPKNIVRATEELLEGLGVTVRRNSRISGVSQHSKGSSTTEVRFEDGTEMTVDLYIDATGLTPNSEFIPPSYLNEKGFLEVDQQLRVPGLENVYGLGDIIDSPTKTIREIWLQVPVLKDAIFADLNGSNESKQRVYCPTGNDTVAITIGRKTGILVYAGWKIPDWAARVLFFLAGNFIVRVFESVRYGWRF